MFVVNISISFLELPLVDYVKYKQINSKEYASRGCFYNFQY